MTPVQKLICERRELLILAAGKSIEIAMALGARENAQRYRCEMEGLIAARGAEIERIEEEGGCFFAASGEISRMQAEARRAVGG